MNSFVKEHPKWYGTIDGPHCFFGHTRFDQRNFVLIHPIWLAFYRHSWREFFSGSHDVKTHFNVSVLANYWIWITPPLVWKQSRIQWRDRKMVLGRLKVGSWRCQMAGHTLRTNSISFSRWLPQTIACPRSYMMRWVWSCKIKAQALASQSFLMRPVPQIWWKHWTFVSITQFYHHFEKQSTAIMKRSMN